MKAGPLLLFGAAALGFFLPRGACAQGSSPVPKGGAAPAEAAEAEEIPRPIEGLVRLEVVTLSRDAARAATRRFPKQADLYAWLGAELEKEKSTVKLERLMVLRVRGGQKSALSEVNAYPFAREFSSAQIPETIGIGQPAPAAGKISVNVPAPVQTPATSPVPTPTPSAPEPGGEPGATGLDGTPPHGPAGSSPVEPNPPPWPYRSAMPKSFTTRDTGWTTEIEMVIDDEGKTVDLNIAPQFIRLCGLESQTPNGEILQPVFETSALACQIHTPFGQPTLAGTFSPPVDAGVAGGNRESITRLLFLTVTDPRSMPSLAQTPEAPLPPAPNPPALPGAQGPSLQTRVFAVPRDFFNNPASSPADPFDQAGAGPNRQTKPKADPKLLLQQLGIEFTVPGATVSYNRTRSQITMTNTLEQLDNLEDVITPFGQDQVRQGQVHLEAFSMPPLVARKALTTHSEERKLYAWVEAQLTKPESGVKLERHSITMVRNGQKSKNQSIAEIPHPSEFGAGKTPQSVALPTGAATTATPAGNAALAPRPLTDAAPQSFEFRNTGDTFELELTFADDPELVDLNLAPETLRRVGQVKFGLNEELTQPIYQIQKMASQAAGFVGQPILLSTFSPPVNTGVPGGNMVDRTWLLFVTVKTPE